MGCTPSDLAALGMWLSDEGPYSRCPEGHRLKPIQAPREKYLCSLCSEDVEEGTTVYGCRACDYDECSRCREKQVCVGVLQWQFVGCEARIGQGHEEMLCSSNFLPEVCGDLQGKPVAGVVIDRAESSCQIEAMFTGAEDWHSWRLTFEGERVAVGILNLAQARPAKAIELAADGVAWFVDFSDFGSNVNCYGTGCHFASSTCTFAQHLQDHVDSQIASVRSYYELKQMLMGHDTALDSCILMAKAATSQTKRHLARRRRPPRSLQRIRLVLARLERRMGVIAFVRNAAAHTADHLRAMCLRVLRLSMSLPSFPQYTLSLLHCAPPDAFQHRQVDGEWDLLGIQTGAFGFLLYAGVVSLAALFLAMACTLSDPPSALPSFVNAIAG